MVPERRISAWGYYAKNRNVHLGKKPTIGSELAMAGVKVHIFLRKISESQGNRTKRWGEISLGRPLQLATVKRHTSFHAIRASSVILKKKFCAYYWSFLNLCATVLKWRSLTHQSVQAAHKCMRSVNWHFAQTSCWSARCVVSQLSSVQQLSLCSRTSGHGCDDST